MGLLSRRVELDTKLEKVRAMSEPDPAPTAPMVHPSDAITQEIKDKMGENAYLLAYLRVDRVRIEPVQEKNKPSTALPYRMHFGSIPNSRYSPTNVSVLLCVGPAGGPPEQRYRTITRLGEIVGSLSAGKAATEVVPASAFWDIKERGSMDPMKVRAVIRYYFIAMKVELPLVWPIDLIFIKELTAACRLAKVQFDRRTEHKIDNLSTSNVGTAPTVAYPAASPLGYDRKGRSSVQEHLNQNNPGVGIQDGLYAPTCNPSGTTAYPRLNWNLSSFTAASSRAPRTREPPRPLTANQRILSPSVTADDCNIARDVEDTQPLVGRFRFRLPTFTDVAQQSVSRVETQEPIDFISSYRKITDDEESHSAALEHNRVQQTGLAQELKGLQSRMNVLRDEESAIKQGCKKGWNEKKHLRHTLSDRERALLKFGIELERKNKRVKLSDDSSIEGGDEEE